MTVEPSAQAPAAAPAPHSSRPSRRVGPCLLSAAVLAAALLLAAGPAHGQIVRGQVVEDGAQTPVEGAMVLLLALDGRVLHRVLTDASGGFILDADAPGRYHLRVDRIGYESLDTPPFDVPPEGTFQRVTVPIRPVELAGLDVSAARRCEVRGEQGGSTARAWEEARKALEAAAWTLSSGTYRYTLLNFERQVEPDLRTVRSEDRRFNRGTGQAPYVSVPAEELAELGFVRENRDGTLTFLAPDAQAFLSDAFLDTHCMRLTGVSDGDVTLAFEPIRGRRLPDIRGTLTLDAASAQLERLDFTYVNLPPDRSAGSAGGQVVFGRLPNGTWIVREWNIRMPLLATDTRRTRLIVTGYLVQGGTVWRVLDRAGETVLEASSASVSGVVVDSAGVALPGAEVRSAGAAIGEVTGGAGTFLLSGLAEGRHILVARHPSLDSLMLGPVREPMDATTGAVTPVRIRIPGVEEHLRAACGLPAAPDPERAILFARVRRRDAPASGVPVRVRWLSEDRRGLDLSAVAAPPLPMADPPVWLGEEDARWIATTLDERGIFMLCGVPVRTQVRIEVGGGAGPEVRTVTVPPDERVVLVTLTLPVS